MMGGMVDFMEITITGICMKGSGNMVSKINYNYPDRKKLTFNF